MSSPVAGLPGYSSSSPNAPWLHFEAFASTLDPQVVPHFATTTERNNAYAAMVTAGGTMEAGILCTVAGVPFRSTGTSTSTWERTGWIRGGIITGITTSGAGDFLISHGLGVTPSSAWVTAYGVGNDAIYGKCTVGSVSSTVISARLYDTRTGAALSGYVGAQFMWAAVAL